MEKKLKSLIQECALNLYNKKQFNFDQKNQFFMSSKKISYDSLIEINF